MKKVLVLMVLFVMAIGAKVASADAIIAAQQADGRIVNSVDVIFAGYVNEILNYKNTVDFRLNGAGGGFGAGAGEWGGIIDGKHDSIGTIGVYINRPSTDVSFNGEPTLWGPVAGVAAWTGTGVGVPTAISGGVWIGGAGSQVGTVANVNTAYPLMNGLIPTPNNKVDVMWATTSGDSMNFGVGLSYGDNQALNTPGAGGNAVVSNSPATAFTNIADTSNTYARNLALNVGLGLKNMGFSVFDVHAGYNYGTFAVSDVTSAALPSVPAVHNYSIQDNGISSITLGAMAQSDMDKDSNLRMFLDGALNSFGTKASFMDSATNDGYHAAVAGDADYENTTSWSQFVLNAGFGCNHSVNDGAAVVGSSLLGTFQSQGTSATESLQQGTVNANASVPTTFTGANSINLSSINISWGANVDAKVSDWLKVRAGIRKSIFNRSGYHVTVAGGTPVVTTTYTGTADALAAAGASFSTGFGIHWQNFVLNTNVTAASLESSIANVAPGNGIFFAGNILTVAEADLGYAF